LTTNLAKEIAFLLFMATVALSLSLRRRAELVRAARPMALLLFFIMILLAYVGNDEVPTSKHISSSTYLIVVGLACTVTLGWSIRFRS